MAINAKVMTEYLKGKDIDFVDFLEPDNENDSGSLVLAFADHTLLRIDGVYDYRLCPTSSSRIEDFSRVAPGIYAIHNDSEDDETICDFSCNEREVRVFDGTWNIK